MACANKNTNSTFNFNNNENKICCCDSRFTYNLSQTGENRFVLTVTPCSCPTAVFDVATITIRENTCNQIEYYQIAINTDPVEIIQDCSLEDGICRAIVCYFNNVELPTCTNRTRNFGFF